MKKDERESGEPYVPKSRHRESTLPLGFQSTVDPAIPLTGQPAGISQPGLAAQDQDVTFDHLHPLEDDEEDEDVMSAESPEGREHGRTDREPAKGGDVTGPGASRPGARQPR